MLPLFTNPVALWGLLALPALAGVYWLRRRHRPHPVSSLMLWQDARESHEGGTVLDRLRTPLLFFLELAALALLAVAAAGPHLPLREGARPLIVVLDDSYSMLAGDDDSPRQQAVRALAEELGGRPRPSVRFLLAGDGTQALGEPAATTAEALDRLTGWRCRAARSRLEEALALAGELGGELPLLLVLTDRAPPAGMPQGRLRWWAFGARRGNAAIVNAARTPHEGGERCLLEIANLADDERDTALTVRAGAPPAELRRETLRLRPRETRTVAFTLPQGTPAVRAELGEDDLTIDNVVSLFPSPARTVGTSVRVKDAALRDLIERALRASGRSVPAEIRPEIVFTDQAGAATGDGGTWRVLLLAERDAVSYAGPFVLDRTHPLAEGLSLKGVAWTAGRSANVPGSPVVLAGDVPLLTDAETAAHAHELRLRLRPDLSTLSEAPAWPVLLCNLLDWRASQRPGLHRANFRLGEHVTMTFATQRPSVTLVRPDGGRQSLPVQDERLTVRADAVGTWAVEADEESASFAVNALSADESDLSGCAAGRWGDWLDDTSLRLEYQSIAWVLLLLVLAVATAHLLLVSRGGRRPRP